MVESLLAPLAIGLVTKLGGTILDRLLEDGGEAGFAVDAGGDVHSLTPLRTGPTTVALSAPGLWASSYAPATDVVTEFAPADSQAQLWLDADQPVILLIEDENDDLDLSSLGLVTQLAAPTPMQLPPGRYSLAAIVFLDDNLDDIDGFGYADFSIDPGEPAFGLVVPIASDADGMVSYALQEFVASRCRAVTRAGERCQHRIGEHFLLVCTSHGKAIEEGSVFLDSVRGTEIDEDEIEVPSDL